jgi:hypothetical protein
VELYEILREITVSLGGIILPLESNRALIMKEGGLMLITAAVEFHQSNPSVISEACRTLYNLVRNGKDSSKILMNYRNRDSYKAGA